MRYWYYKVICIDVSIHNGNMLVFTHKYFVLPWALTMQNDIASFALSYVLKLSSTWWKESFIWPFVMQKLIFWNQCLAAMEAYLSHIFRLTIEMCRNKYSFSHLVRMFHHCNKVKRGISWTQHHMAFLQPHKKMLQKVGLKLRYMD